MSIIEAGSRFSSPEDFYDQHPNGWGEPSPRGVPGIRTIPVSGLKNKNDFLRVIRKGGPVRELIHELRDKGKAVGLKWTAHEVTVFVADHKREILGIAGAAATITGVIGAIYFARRSPRKK